MTEAPDFEGMYRRDADPFGVRTSWYERRKLAVVLASLTRSSYAAAWDPACGTGDLAVALAARCDHVLASDLSARAVQITGELADGRAGIDVQQRSLPLPPPDAPPLDLIVLAEVLYYLPDEQRAQTYSMVDEIISPHGPAEIATVHWRHHPNDAYLSGAAVTRELGGALLARGWDAAVRHEDPDFVVATWVRNTGQGS